MARLTGTTTRTILLSALCGAIALSPVGYVAALHGFSDGMLPGNPAMGAWARTELSVTVASTNSAEVALSSAIGGAMPVVASAEPAIPHRHTITRDAIREEQVAAIAETVDPGPETEQVAVVVTAPAHKPAVPATPVATTADRPAVQGDGVRRVYAGRIDNTHLQTAVMSEDKPEPVAVVAAKPVVQQAMVGEDMIAARDQTPPWLRYAVASAAPKNQPKIAIVIDDLGLSKSRATRTAALPGPLTMAFLPYADNLPEQARAASAAGHELLIHMPMEPYDASQDPGPKAMRVSLSETELLRRLRSALSSFDGYVGINNHMGSKFTSDTKGMMVVLKELQRRGLMFLDSQTSSKSVGGDLAESLGMPTAKRSVFIDHDRDPAAVRRSLAQLETTARHFGVAVGIGHPHRVTLEALAEWLPSLKQRGIALVPISAVAKLRMEAQNQQVAAASAR